MRFKTHTGRKPLCPELVASKEQHRPVLTNVHLDVDKGQVVATDSYMLARFPVELDEGDTSGPIPVDALKASRKPPLKLRTGEDGVSIRANRNVEVVQGEAPYLSVPRGDVDYTFPNADSLFPAVLADFTIGLNAAKLAQLAKALGSDEVVLQFTAGKDGNPEALRPILVRPISRGDDDPDGILMPIRHA